MKTKTGVSILGAHIVVLYVSWSVACTVYIAHSGCGWWCVVGGGVRRRDGRTCRSSRRPLRIIGWNSVNLIRADAATVYTSRGRSIINNQNSYIIIIFYFNIYEKYLNLCIISPFHFSALYITPCTHLLYYIVYACTCVYAKVAIQKKTVDRKKYYIIRTASLGRWRAYYYYVGRVPISNTTIARVLWNYYNIRYYNNIIINFRF